jgi:hypothetical protein
MNRSPKNHAALAGTIAHAAAEAYIQQQLAAGTEPLFGSRVVENRGQAMPKGAQRAISGSRGERKAKTRAAANELAVISQKTLDVSHLHPRWLRELVLRALGAGQEVTQEDVGRWRAQGRRPL